MITPFDPAWPEIPRRPARIEPMETHVRLSVGWCLLTYVLGIRGAVVMAICVVAIVGLWVVSA